MTIAIAPNVSRLRITLHGAVQGVGFRPTLYRLAGSMRLGGWVRNTGAGLEVEVEGEAGQLDKFLLELRTRRPNAAVISSEEIERVAPSGGKGFEILPSEEAASAAASRTAFLLPDLATCSECLADLVDATNRRFGYPFTNCTLCGPRYSIQLDIPYDRPCTTMRSFAMCLACRREYDSYKDRRFHAQPNACAACGPALQFWPAATDSAQSWNTVAGALKQGKIVAVKGIGGFQLLTDARNSSAVVRLRERKHRNAKPFAVLMPSIDCIRRYCVVRAEEEELLLSSAAPIVLLEPHDGHDLAPEIAQGSSKLGVMLACSPLHHLLMACFPFPVVATSGNMSGEPLAIDNTEAMARLYGIADLFVMHNRPIARACDDSVVRHLNGPQVLRRARGYAPLPVLVPRELPAVLAVGGHLKNTIAIAIGRQIFVSQHLGDLDSLEAREGFERAIEDFCALYRFTPQIIVSDLHPDYASTLWAKEQVRSGGPRLLQVQHHHAHIAGCAAENGLQTNYLGVAWDGSGLGSDGTLWGGESFVVNAQGFARVAHLRPFPLPGGEAAMRDCSRSAAGVLWMAMGAGRARNTVQPNIATMLKQNIQSPLTSSVGRLFDAVAYLAGVSTNNQFEGQAAMALESLLGRHPTTERYQIDITDDVGDWSGLIHEVLRDTHANVALAVIAAKFHNALAHWILMIARQAGVHDVVLSGGVFQNAYLTSRSMQLLQADGFTVYTNRLVPANDGGLAFGQAVLAGHLEEVFACA